MTEHAILNDDSPIDSNSVRELLGRTGISGYVEWGMEFIPDHPDNRLDVASGRAYILDSHRDYPVHNDGLVGVPLESNAVNDIYLVWDAPDGSGEPAIEARGSGQGPSSTPALQIGWVDTAQQEHNELNRELPIASPFEDIDGDGVVELPGHEGIEPGTVTGVEFLPDSLGETEVRTRIANASEGATFVVEPGASWQLTDTLSVPSNVSIYGNTPINTGAWTFLKTFDGPLVTFGDFCSFYNVAFHGFRADGHTGNVADTASSRDCYFRQVQFTEGEGHGYSQEDGFFNTFDSCRFQKNGGYGVRLGDSEGPHNQWRGPCYIGDNDTGGAYIGSYGRNQQWHAWIGNNGGPGIVFNGQRFYGFGFRGQIIDNDGPAVHVAAGEGVGAATFTDTVFASNCQNPSTGLTTPVGQIHVSGGWLEGIVQSSNAYGHHTLHRVAGDAYQTFAYQCPGNTGTVSGDIVAPTLSLWMNDMNNFDWETLNVRQGIGVRIAGGPSMVDLVTGDPFYSALDHDHTGESVYPRRLEFVDGSGAVQWTARHEDSTGDLLFQSETGGDVARLDSDGNFEITGALTESSSP